MAVDKSRYVQFKRWWESKFGKWTWNPLWDLMTPFGYSQIEGNQYYNQFLRETGIEPMTGAVEQPAQGAMVDQPSTEFFTPPVSPEQLQEEENAKKLGLTLQQYRQFVMGMPESYWNPKTTNDEPTWYQREQAAQGRIQLGQQQADIMNQQRNIERARISDAMQFEQQRISMRGQDNTAGLIAQERAKMADQFNQLQQMIMSGTAPRDWVVRETARGTANPFVEQPIDWAEQSKRAKSVIASSEADWKEASQVVKDLRARLDDSIPSNNPQPGEIAAAEYRRDALKQEVDIGKKVLRQNELDEPAPTTSWGAPSSGEAEEGYAGGGGSIQAKTKPFAPNIPAGVIPFLESPEFGAKVTPTSGQQWFNTSPTAQQQLFGYLESQKQSPEDYLWNMQRSLPQTPSLGRKWSPARSMV